MIIVADEAHTYKMPDVSPNCLWLPDRNRVRSCTFFFLDMKPAVPPSPGHALFEKFILTFVYGRGMEKKRLQTPSETSSASFEDIIFDLLLLLYLVTLVTSYSIRSGCVQLGGKAACCKLIELLS